VGAVGAPPLRVGLCGARRRLGGRRFLLLSEDLFNFAQRLGNVIPSSVLHPLATVAVALGVPAAAFIGRLFARPYLRFVAIAAALGAGALNHWILLNDYPGAHFYLAVSAVAIGVGAISGAIPPWRRGGFARTPARAAKLRAWAAALGQAALALWAACSLVARPTAAVLSELFKTSGSVVAPLFAGVLSRFSARRASIPTDSKVWFQSRLGLSPVAPSDPRLLTANGIVLLLSIDAMRADVLADPKHAGSLPTLTALRRESIEFTQARSPGSQTVYSLSTLFAGTYFSQQYWTPMANLEDRSLWLPEDTTVRFPELLTAAGVPTVTFAAAVWMRNAWGVVRGFSEEQFVPTRTKYASAVEVAGPAIERIRRHGDGPLFLFVHFLDPHAPYDRGAVTGTPFQRYVGEIALVDKELQRIREALEEKGFMDRAAIIVTADHGEAFGEHGTTAHATTLYEEQIRVPLLVRVPRLRPRKVDQPVSLVDLGPTVLDLFGQPTPGHVMGQSLVPILRGERVTLTRPIVAEGRLKRAMIFPDGYKVIADDRSGVVEAYDLRKDPGELHNRCGEDPEADRRIDVLRAFFAAHTIRRTGYKVPYRR
jgi:arylsulfatase A-like enzyme